MSDRFQCKACGKAEVIKQDDDKPGVFSCPDCQAPHMFFSEMRLLPGQREIDWEGVRDKMNAQIADWLKDSESA